MVLGTTALLIFLLVCAASLASYLFSRWLAARTGRTIGWAAIALGTVFLLAAATIAVLATGLLSALQWPERAADEASTPAQVGDLSPVPEPAHGEGTEQQTAGQSIQARTGTAARPRTGDRPVGATSPAQSAAGETQWVEKISSSGTSADAASAPPPGRAAGVIVNPWAATRCVRAFHPDPEDLDRWSIENECLGPVAVLLAICMQSADECNARQAVSWKYQRGGMILPAKAQRPVSVLEDTLRGRQVRFVACFVTTPAAIGLIGSNSETRASAWLEQFATARENDECLADVQRLAAAGAHTGASIDAVLGGTLSKGTDPTQ
jgi:hypothetical protein